MTLSATAQPTTTPAPAAKPPVAAPAAKPATAPAAAPAAKPAAPAPAPAAAKPPEKELWFVAKTGSGAIAYDAHSIKHDPNTGVVTFNNALYLTTPQQTPNKTAFQFVVANDRIDCIGGRFQPVGRLLLADGGKIVDQFDTTDTKTWHPLSGNPPLAFLHRIACKGNALGKSKQATGFVGAMKLMREMAAAK
jgi:hypothetical protein